MPVTKISKKEIVDIALTEFLRDGIQALTIKQLSELAGISTKTVYRLFDDKTALLRICLSEHYARFTEELFEIPSNTENEVETFLSVIHRAVTLEFGINQKFYSDLNKYYPALQNEALLAIGRLHLFFSDIVDQGKNNGYFMPDINTGVLLIGIQKLYSAITRENAFGALQLSAQVLIQNTVLVYLRGMCTPLGLQNLKRYERSFCKEVAKPETNP